MPISLSELPHEIIFNILSQPSLSQADVAKFLSFHSFSTVALLVISRRTGINLYFLPNYRNANQGCQIHAVALPPQDKPWCVQVPFHDPSEFSNWDVNLATFTTFQLFIFISDFTVGKLDKLRFLKGFVQKKITLHIHFILPFEDSLLTQVLENVSFDHNDIKVILYLQYFTDLQLETEWSPNVDIVLCSRTFDTVNPINITINPELQSFQMLNHFVTHGPPIKLKIKSPNYTTEFRFIGKPRNSPELLKSLVLFPHLESLYLENVTIHKLSTITKGLPKLKFLDLINTPISDFTNVSLADAFPKLQHFHIESGSSDNDLHVQNMKFSSCLKSFKISRKSMDTFKDVVIPGGSLVNLDLSFNDLLELELDEGISSHIYEVNLSYNRRLIHSIPLYRNKPFSDYLFHNVTQLHLDGCNITNEVLERICSLHDGAKPMVSRLEVLSLAKNDLLNLRCFHSQLLKSTRLRKLDLSFNKFSYLNKDNFPINKYTFPNIDYINFTGNCSLKSIQGIVLDYNYLHVKLLNTGIHEVDISIFPGQHNSIVYK